MYRTHNTFSLKRIQ